MCKGCKLGDVYGYLDGYSVPFESAAKGIAEARKWLNKTAHDTHNEQHKHHLLQTKARLDLIAREMSDIRDEFLREEHR